MIAEMLRISTKCIIFDVFSTKFADHKKPNNIYVDPSIFCVMAIIWYEMGDDFA